MYAFNGFVQFGVQFGPLDLNCSIFAPLVLNCINFGVLDFWIFWIFLDFGALPQPAQNPSPSGERLWGLAAQFSVQFGPLDLNYSIFGPLDLNSTDFRVLDFWIFWIFWILGPCPNQPRTPALPGSGSGAWLPSLVSNLAPWT